MKRSIWVVVVIVFAELISSGQKGTYSGGSNAAGSQDSGGSTDQSGGGGGGGGAKGGGGGGGQNGGGGGGFSIESEMLAYKALESDSEAIACDVAAYLLYETPTSEKQLIYPAGKKAAWGDSGTDPRWKRLGQICTHVLDDGAPPVQIAQDEQQVRQERWGVIVLSSNDPTISNVQAWRLNMAILGVLLQRAGAYASCCPAVSTPSCPQLSGSAAATDDHGILTGKAQGATGVPGLDIASSTISLIQGAAQLFAVNESVTGVAGTIGDQALIDGIGRHFRSMAIPVLAPGIYPSYALEAQWDATNGYNANGSLFLSGLQKLSGYRLCLQGQIQDLTKKIADANQQLKKASNDADDASTAFANAKSASDRAKTEADKSKSKTEMDKSRADKNTADATVQRNTAAVASLQLTLNDIQAIATSIDNYVTSLFGGMTQSKSSQSADNPGKSTSDPSSKATDSSKTSSTANPSTSSPDSNQGQSQSQAAQNAPINAILAADGVVRRLNYGEIADVYRWQILSVKALESGGGVLTKSNLFGSKLYFSGGAVATYALFQVDGSLSCSGNVYDYDGYIREKNFTREFRKPNISPDKQMVFYRGRCSYIQTEIPLGPHISFITPAIVASGERLTISGSAFGAIQGTSTVKIGSKDIGQIAAPDWSSSSITVRVPLDIPAGSSTLVVTVRTLSSAPYKINIESRPNPAAIPQSKH